MGERQVGRTLDPFRCLLVPTDFSSGADLALSRAARLRLAPKAKVLVVHVLAPGLSVRLRSQAEADAWRRLEKAAALVAETARASGQSTVTVERELISGRAFVEIIRRARAASADLVVLGRHGQRPVRDMFIGSTAERVVRKGDVPVLVVSRKPTHVYRRPLIATDLDDSSKRILELALRAVDPNVRVMPVVHAFHVPFKSRLARDSPAAATAFWRACRDEARSNLAALLESWSVPGLRWNPILREGDARGIVLNEAAHRKSDLIAIGTHGRAGMAHALVGSVAEWVIRAARCDVLVSRPVRFSFELP
jgi:nucleotide-binding universal stress UspA family protein